jgi:hypothetical protein
MPRSKWESLRGVQEVPPVESSETRPAAPVAKPYGPCRAEDVMFCRKCQHYQAPVIPKPWECSHCGYSTGLYSAKEIEGKQRNALRIYKECHSWENNDLNGARLRLQDSSPPRNMVFLRLHRIHTTKGKCQHEEG